MTVDSLREHQQALQRYLIDPNFNPDGLIVSSANALGSARLQIYGNAYKARFVEAMSADYNALHTYLGDDEFEVLVHAYLARNPSRNFSLRPFGEHLSSFLETTAPFAGHLELHELARFEWALCEAFDAADAPHVQTAELAALPPQAWPQLILEFHPSLQCVGLRSNAPALWSALNNNDVPPALAFNEAATPWLVWRHRLKLLFRPMQPIEAQMLTQFCVGATFAEICEILADQFAEEEVPLQALGVLQQWLREGLVAAIELV